MEYLRSSVNLRAYGQRDPLVEYKKEGLRMFQVMDAGYKARALEILSQMTLNSAPAVAQAALKEGDAVRKAAMTITKPETSVKVSYGRNDYVTISDGTQVQTLKYKKAEPLLREGKWHIVENVLHEESQG